MKSTVAAIIFIFGISSSVQAKDITLPKPTGTHSVGTRSLEAPGKVMIQVFYPTDPQAETFPYMPGTIDGGMINNHRILSHGKPDANFVKSDQMHPIIFVPGLGQKRQDFTILSEELASQGYVVFALDMPGFSGFIKYPDGHTDYPSYTTSWRIFSDDAWDFDDKPGAQMTFYMDATHKISEQIGSTIKHLSQHVDYKDLGFDRPIISGVGLGAAAAASYALRNPSLLVSLFDNSELAIMAEGQVQKYMIFIRNKSSTLNKHYENWTESMNNQEGLAQSGEKPTLKKWMTITKVSPYNMIVDAAYLQSQGVLDNPSTLSRAISLIFHNGPQFYGYQAYLEGAGQLEDTRPEIVNWLKDHINLKN